MIVFGAAAFLGIGHLYISGALARFFGKGQPLELADMVCGVEYHVLEHSRTIFFISDGIEALCYRLYAVPPLGTTFTVFEDGDGNRHFMVEEVENIA